MTGWPEPVHDRRHPPFEPGHELSTKHGAWSPRKYEPLADQLVAGMLVLAERDPLRLGYLGAPQHAASLWAWARTEARIQLISEWLLSQGSEVDEDGEVTAASKLQTRLEARAESLRARLGLDPRSEAELRRARVGADLAGFDLAAALRAGQEVIDARSSGHEDGVGVEADAGGIPEPVGDEGSDDGREEAGS